MRIKSLLTLSYGLVFVVILSLAGAVGYYLVGATVQRYMRTEQVAVADAACGLVKTAAMASIRNGLRVRAEDNLDILQGLEEEVLSGRMSRAEAHQAAERILLSQQVGESGYIYALTSEGFMAVHPRGLKGRDMSASKIGKKQIRMRSGYVEYDWANPTEEVPRPKIMYMAYFEPWDWIVSVTAYREESQYLINIEDFRSTMESIRVGESGYVFIIDRFGNMVLHPWLDGNVAEMRDAEGVKLVREMQDRQNGRIEYFWKDSSDSDPREKLAAFQYVPELDWIVAASGYFDEINAPMVWLRNVMIVAGVCSLLVILPLSIFLGNTITRPIYRLAGRMKAAASGDLSVRGETDAPGEIGDIAGFFNEYMDGLTTFSKQLIDGADGVRTPWSHLKLFEMVFLNALEGISITDKDGRIVAVNPAFSKITGYTQGEVLGQNPRVLKSERHDPKFYREMWDSLKAKGSWEGEIWNRRKNGESYPEILSITSVRDDRGDISHYVAVFHDISDMKLKDKQLEHQAYHDGLTGLPNRVLVQDRLSVAISHARRTKTMVAAFYMDIDKFKDVNDSLGHAQGDRLIQAVADRIAGLLPEQDTVARLGGDEFLVLGVDLASERDVVERAEKLLTVFDAPFVIMGHELFITTSMGVAVYPNDGHDPASLVRNADVAMYQSKARGRNSYMLFTQEMHNRISRRLTMERDVRQALVNDEFTVYFQPKVDPFTGEVVGLEALVRWIKSNGAVVSPFEFIPLAEQTGLIVPLGKFVLEASCKAIQVLDGVGCQNIKVAVNLSPLQFGQEDMVDMIVSSMERNGVSPSQLELEITESTLMTNVQDSIAKLDELVAHGISIAIDDFGTGHSSLYYLKNFPIDVLKIDRSFVRDITEDESDALIVETVVLMAKNLGIGVVAEGVETLAQLDMLKSFGCELIQGYYYSKPLPLEKVIEYVRSENGICRIRDEEVSPGE